jgi:hypothetical protein
VSQVRSDARGQEEVGGHPVGPEPGGAEPHRPPSSYPARMRQRTIGVVGVTTVRNAPFPAATSSMAIAELVADRVLRDLSG